MAQQESPILRVGLNRDYAWENDRDPLAIKDLFNSFRVSADHTDVGDSVTSGDWRKQK
jgi:hypothetical protein